MAKAIVTGIGCVTPIGIGVEPFTRALRAGVSGLGPMTLCDPTPYQCKVAAEVRDFDPRNFLPLKEARSSPRVVHLAVAAARLAMQDAQLAAWPDPARVGVILGSSVGPGAYTGEQVAIFLERGVRRVHPSFPAQGHYGVIASECAIQLGIHGPVMSTSSACTSSADAIGIAVNLLESGMVDMILTGGAEAPIFPMLFAAFDRLSMMPTQFNDCPEAACRPFSADRDGFVLGEGAAIFVLERPEVAAARGARQLAEVIGYSATCDAFHHFAQDEQGEDATRAVLQALQQADALESIDYINAHGTATLFNDPFETALFHRVLGERAHTVPISSTKSVLGHLMGASSAVELAATIVGMRAGFIPPTMNLDSPDRSCDLDYVPNKARPGFIRTALSTSFGFGSRNAALVVRRCGDEASDGARSRSGDHRPAHRDRA